jgi:hypothetical protein
MEHAMVPPRRGEDRPQIQEICDSLHRLEALITVTLPIPAENPAAVQHGFVFFGSALYGDAVGS